jgi:hypothetical protein
MDDLPNFRCYLLPPQVTEHLDSRRTKPCIVVVGIRINLDVPLVNFGESVCPVRQLPAPVYDDLVPDFCLLLDCFAIPKPAHIGEVGGNGIELLEPLRARARASPRPMAVM